MRFMRLKWYDRSHQENEDIINFDSIIKIEKEYAINSPSVIFIFTEGDYLDLQFENESDADQCFDYLMDKIHACSIEKNPW